MGQSLCGRTKCRTVVVLQHAKSMQRVQRVNRAHVQANAINGLVFNQRDEFRNNLGIAVFDEQPLCVQADKHGWVCELIRSTQFKLVGVFDFRLEACPTWFVWYDAINTAVLLVSQLGFVGCSLTRFKTLWRWVVLHNEVVPIEYPDVPIGTNLRHDRSCPFIIAGKQIDRAAGFHTSTITLDHKGTDKLARWSTHECGTVPPGLRIIASRIQSVSSGCGVAPVMIDLPNFFRNGLE